MSRRERSICTTEKRKERKKEGKKCVFRKEALLGVKSKRKREKRSLSWGPSRQLNIYMHKTGSFHLRRFKRNDRYLTLPSSILQDSSRISIQYCCYTFNICRSIYQIKFLPFLSSFLPSLSLSQWLFFCWPIRQAIYLSAYPVLCQLAECFSAEACFV